MPVSLQKDVERFTYAHYVTWPAEERWELIDGIPYDMSPAPSRYHQEISMNLGFEISKFLKGKKCKVYAAPFDVRLPEGAQTDEETMTVVQPDISVVCDPEKLDDKGCKGAPDFIAEITSLSTIKKDMKDKLLLYEKNGVPEYWIIQPEENIIMVHKLNEQKQYDRAKIFSKEDKIELNLKDGTIEIDLGKIF
ncbi:MAG: Uma2 family endonuclease [Candidatus Omnitrophota bacterium]